MSGDTHALKPEDKVYLFHDVMTRMDARHMSTAGFNLFRKLFTTLNFDSVRGFHNVQTYS